MSKIGDEVLRVEESEDAIMSDAVEKVNSELKRTPAPTLVVSTPVANNDNGAGDTDASKFKKFVESAKLAITIGDDGKKYLLAEAWQYIIAMKQLNLECICTESHYNSVLAVTCICTLRDADDKVVSTGMMTASSNEEWLKDKGQYAMYGMAQTRAISRAVRNRYGYIARACGYDTTPFDEMPKVKNDVNKVKRNAS